MSFKIPNPCHENWNEMQPREQGRHCLQCCKTVVDFTNWPTERIEQYLIENSQQKVCGRFRKEQLDATPSKEVLIEEVWKSSLSFYKKMAAIVILFFAVAASSCNNYVNGKPLRDKSKIETADTTKPVKDTDIIVGKLVIPDTLLPAPRQIPPPKINMQKFCPPRIIKDTKTTELMGDVELDTTAQKSDSLNPS